MSSRIVILGSGESGTGAALLAHSKGYDVFVSDMGIIGDAYKAELNNAGITYEEGKHTVAEILNADEIIKSPGIPHSVDIVQQALHKYIPVISEIEFAARYSTGKKICVTGTNGKTTTTSLIYHMLKTAGLNAAVGGNIGTSFARLVLNGEYDYYVLELSSFQLDDMYRFKADIAVLTNITPDHLDRYDYKLENYIAAKFRITQNQSDTDVFIYCADDALTAENLYRIKGEATAYSFAYDKINIPGAWIAQGELHVQLNNQENFNSKIMYSNELSLKGRHNGYNSMAAAIIGQVLNIRKETIRESMMSFQNVEHRLEHVITIAGVEYINDSKATNVNSAWYALESMEKPVIWIAGGVD